jgi:hypothetical protein
LRVDRRADAGRSGEERVDIARLDAGLLADGQLGRSHLTAVDGFDLPDPLSDRLAVDLLLPGDLQTLDIGIGQLVGQMDDGHVFADRSNHASGGEGWALDLLERPVAAVSCHERRPGFGAAGYATDGVQVPVRPAAKHTRGGARLEIVGRFGGHHILGGPARFLGRGRCTAVEADGGE